MKESGSSSQQQNSRVSRRSFMASAAAAAVAIPTASSVTRAQQAPKKFKLKYAPGFGMFKQHAGSDPIDQIKFMADQGLEWDYQTANVIENLKYGADVCEPSALIIVIDAYRYCDAF